MARVKRAVNAHKKRRVILDRAKGYRGQRSRLYRKAKEQVIHSLVYSYRDRRQRKGDFRRLWIQRINAAARANEMTYNRFMQGLKLAEVQVDRRMLAELAVSDEAAFAALVDVAKKALPSDVNAPLTEEGKKNAEEAAKRNAKPTKEEKAAKAAAKAEAAGVDSAADDEKASKNADKADSDEDEKNSDETEDDSNVTDEDSTSDNSVEVEDASVESDAETADSVDADDSEEKDASDDVDAQDKAAASVAGVVGAKAGDDSVEVDADTDDESDKPVKASKDVDADDSENAATDEEKAEISDKSVDKADKKSEDSEKAESDDIADHAENSKKVQEEDFEAIAARFEGAKPANKDGSAPGEGLIKGNENSMLYHVPGSKWYDETIAEVYFETAEAAKSAGFKPAGGAAEQKM